MQRIPAMAKPNREDSMKTETGPCINVNNPKVVPSSIASTEYAYFAGMNSKILPQMTLPTPVNIALQETPMIAIHGAKPLSAISAAW